MKAIARLERLLGIDHEVSAADVEQRRTDGGKAYSAYTDADALYTDALNGGLNPWTVPPGLQGRVLVARCLYVLQSLGDNFIASDYLSDSASVGRMPVVTLEQVKAFYAPIEVLLRRNNAATANPKYRLELHMRVPMDLPAIVEAEGECPRTHLDGMCQALIGSSEFLGIRALAEAALATFVQYAPTKYTEQILLVRQRMAEAAASADLVEASWARDKTYSKERHEALEESVKYALSMYFRLIQVMAMPNFADIAHLPDEIAAAEDGGQLERFDAWRELGAPGAFRDIGHDPRYTRDMDKLTRALNKPENRDVLLRVRRLLALVQQAVDDGILVEGGWILCCPFPRLYRPGRGQSNHVKIGDEVVDLSHGRELCVWVDEDDLTVELQAMVYPRGNGYHSCEDDED